MKWIARVVACWLLCALAPAAAEPLRFDPPIGWTAADALPAGVLYAARSADGRMALCVERGPAEDLDALVARYRGEPCVTVGARWRAKGYDALPLWEHRPDGDEPFTLHLLACAANGALYRFALFDFRAAGADAARPAQTLRELNIRFTKEASP